MKIKDPTIKKMLKIYLEKNKVAVINKWFEETSDILKICKYVGNLVIMNGIDVVDINELNNINIQLLKKYINIMDKYYIKDKSNQRKNNWN